MTWVRYRRFDPTRSAVVVCFLLALTGCQPKELTSAKIYIQSNDWDKALQHLENAVEVHPNNAEAHCLLGKAYGQHGRYKEMNREFEISLMVTDKFEAEIRAEREQHWIDKYNNAIAAMTQEEYARAEELLRKAITIEPSRYEAYKKLALTYLNVDKTDKALLLYSKLLEKKPDDVDLLSSTGNLYYSQKQFDKVIPILKRILVLEPNHRDALANLALCYDSLGETEQAAHAYQKAIAVNPQDKDLVFLFGAHRYNRKQFPKAIQLFEQVLTMNPDDFESTSNIGNAYLSMAEELRLRLKESRNGSTAAEVVIRLKNEAIRNYKNAIPYLEKSLEMRPNHPTLWRNLGIAYINTGEKEKGEQAFLKAEELQVQSAK